MPQKNQDINFFFNPKTIAVIGASPNQGKPSYVILESLKKIGFPGNIYPVNPKYPSINGLRCYGSIAEIEGNIDLAVIAIPAPLVLDSLRDMGNKVKGVIIVSAGFKEVGEEGKRLEEGIKELAQREGIRIIGPNCLGIYDTISRVDTFFIPADRIGRPGRGGISILSQSGSFAATIMDEMAAEGIGVARVVSFGNRVDVGESDCLDFLADDEETKVIALYLESVDDGRRFVEAASRCVKKKPVVAVKVGKREAGVYAARSHTGAMTGRYEIYRAAFRKAGIIEVEGYEGLKDACRAFNIYRPARGKRVLIVTDGGGIGVSLADACEDFGLEVAGLKEETKKRLSSKLPSFCAFGNPIDLTGSVTDEWYVTALTEGLKDGFDIAIVTVLWGPPQLTDGLIDRLAGVIKGQDKPVIICTPGGGFTKRMNRAFEEKGIPVFATPESAARAAGILAKARRKA
ncbi:MAG: CoA-binding protein [Deltaproteobacteria bacterium]|nr:CoA-binding protein [Deltaproteobacteria bacterium]